jgi:solute carrier family 1 (neuronal/epithelial high affinity glutamate transporter), member 1
MKPRNLLTALIFLGLILGVLLGQFLLYDSNPVDASAHAAKLAGWYTAGDLIFLRPLRMLIIPLVFTSVLTGIMSIGDPKKLGMLGGATVLFYVTTMIFAVVVGVTMAATLMPGAGLSETTIQAGLSDGASKVADVASGAVTTQGIGGAWLNILYQMIPNNFLQSAVEVQALSVISATILLGIGVVVVGEKTKPFQDVVEALHEVLMTIVQWILWLMPLGVMFLVAWAVGKIGIGTLFEALGKYVVIVLAGLLIHMALTLPAVLWVLTRINPYRFMWKMRAALLTAFGTSSSMATLPVTIETCHEAGCSKRATGLVLPLGATVNMDGTALYQGVTVIFLFQAFGYELGFAQYLATVLTATLAAIGTAAVPGASFITMMIIITAVNTTLAGGVEGFNPLPLAAIGLIVPVDRILDMCRTTVNVWGDSVGARAISRLAPDIEEDREAAYA